jgi:NAD(P)-dependent dehydrogenase (short-subunit alcohol dehydrogenase family)
VTRLGDHVSVVTGGNGGIGLGLARGVAEAGAAVSLWGTNPAKNERAAAALRDEGFRVHTAVCDVSDEAQVVAAYADTVAALGKVDSVFANAGISNPVRSVLDLSLEEWRRVMAVNLDGVFLTLREGARHMVERGEGGSLIAISSTSAIHGAQFNPHYGASKSGVLGLVRAMAVGLARHKIRVNALLPGWTETDMIGGPAASEKFIHNTTTRTPVRRWADPSEYEAAAVLLADPSLTFHTGDSMVIDGGYTIF